MGDITSRRAFLASVVMGGFAGCVGDDDAPSPTLTPTPTPTPTPTAEKTPTPPETLVVESLPHTLVDGMLPETWETTFRTERPAWLILEVHDIDPLDEGVLLRAPDTQQGSGRFAEGGADFRELDTVPYTIGIELDEGYADTADVTLSLHDWYEVNPYTITVGEDWGEFVDAWDLPATILDNRTLTDLRVSVRTDEESQLEVSVANDAPGGTEFDLYRQHPQNNRLANRDLIHPGETRTYDLWAGIHALWPQTHDTDETVLTATLEPA